MYIYRLSKKSNKISIIINCVSSEKYIWIYTNLTHEGSVGKYNLVWGQIVYSTKGDRILFDILRWRMTSFWHNIKMTELQIQIISGVTKDKKKL